MIQERLELGPIHTWLPGTMKMNLGMSGDQMLSAEPVFGYATRSIEKNMVGRSIEHAQYLFSRVEPESALLLDRLYGEAVEQMCEQEVSGRTEWIRNITSDLSELNFQLKFMAKMAARLGVKILYHSILKHRENLLDLFELLSGSRYGYYYILPGGVRYDLTDGFQERLEAWISAFLQDYGRIEALFCWTHGLQNRLRSMGVVMDTGEYGFVSKAAVEGTRFGQVSHVESRLLHALGSSKRLAEGLATRLTQRPEGSVRIRLPARLKSEAVADWQLETIRGTWGLRLALDPELLVSGVSVRSPSDSIRNAIFPALEGESIEDLPLILESLSLSVPEIDR
jgi:NADH-quinone oxidoreductase subunit D